MSVRATNWAWGLGRAGIVEGGELLTLLRVADHADNDGVCWPGEKHVAEYTGKDQRTVRRHLEKLEGKDLLCRERVAQSRGRGRANDRIMLDLDQPANLSGKKSGDQPDTDDASTGHSEHVQPDTGDTALHREPSVEPSRTKNPPTPQGGDSPDPIAELFEFWKGLTGRNGSTQLTPKRRRAIKARLDDSTVPELRRAIVGCIRSDFHMKRGKHASREGDVYDELTLIFRNRDKVEEFCKLAGKAPLPGVDASPNPITDLERAKVEWETATEIVAASVPDSTFNLWIAPLEAAGFRDGRLVLVDSDDRASWTNRRYTTLIGEALEKAGGSATKVEIVDETTLELEAA